MAQSSPPAADFFAMVKARSRHIFSGRKAKFSSSIIGPVLKESLKVLGKVLSTVCPGASVVCDSLTMAIDKYEAMNTNIAALESLKTHLEHIAGAIVAELGGKDVSKLSEQVLAALNHLGSGLIDIRLSALLEGQPKKTIAQFLNSDGNAAEIRQMFVDVGRLVAVFVFKMTLAGHFTLSEVRQSIDNKVLTDNIKSLPHVGAAYNSNHAINKKRTVCLSGTRVDLLEEIGRWAVAEDEKPIYLLTGHAGFGKSTIVRTVAERLDVLHVLGASFFFSRDDTALRSNSNFFSTLAYQLCVFDEVFATRIGHALKSLTTADVVDKSPAAQLDSLIVKPLKSFNDTSHTVVIVVDALDECEDLESPDGEKWRRDIWDGLVTLVEKLPFVRVFLTSRPHQLITTAVKRNPHLYINNASIEATDPDIRRYLRHELIEARKPPQEWIAKDSEISALDVMAAGLFIVAATVVRFVLHARRAKSPSDRIRDLTEGTISGSTNSNDKLEAVNKMYKKVLDLSLSLDDSDELQLFQTVIGSIIFLTEQFNLEDLAILLALDITIIRNLIDKLQAIITLTDDKPQFHKSFVDYITDHARSSELCISQSQAHTVLAFCCFHVLGAGVGNLDVIEYGAMHINDHCAAADPTILNRNLSNTRPGLQPSFWVLDVACRIILRMGHIGDSARSTVLLYMGASKCNKEAVEVLNLDVRREEVLSEETLRLILTSKSMEDGKIYERFSAPALVVTQYLKTLLYHLSNNEMWREDWICPPVGHCLRDYRVFWVTTNADLLDLALGNHGEGWAGSIFSHIYGTFEPTDEARSILKQKLLEADPELAAMASERYVEDSEDGDDGSGRDEDEDGNIRGGV